MKVRMGAALRAACFGVAGPARAEIYGVIVRGAPIEFAKRERRDVAAQTYWTACADCGQALQSAGILRGGSSAGFRAPAAATGRVDVHRVPAAPAIAK